MTPFLCSIFNAFHDQKEVWSAALNILSELDCLASLSIVSGASEGTMCRPKLLEYTGDYATSSILELKSMRHPCVTLNSNKAFIPNDTIINPN